MYKHPFCLCLIVTWFFFYEISTVANFSHILLEIVFSNIYIYILHYTNDSQHILCCNVFPSFNK